MSNISTLIKSVTEKCQELMLKVENLLGENQLQANKIADLESKILLLENENASLNSQIKELKTIGAISQNSESSKEAKLRINELVREIDQCIALLNK